MGFTLEVSVGPLPTRRHPPETGILGTLVLVSHTGRRTSSTLGQEGRDPLDTHGVSSSSVLRGDTKEGPFTPLVRRPFVQVSFVTQENI